MTDEDFKYMDELRKTINRQEAEIDRLKKENEILSINADTAFQDGLNESRDLYACEVKSEIKSEAIKEFADRLKGKKQVVFTAVNDSSYAVTVENINNLVKEMAGDDNA